MVYNMIFLLLILIVKGYWIDMTSSQNKHVFKDLKAISAEVEHKGDCCKCQVSPKYKLKFIQKIPQPKDSWILFFHDNLMVTLNKNTLKVKKIQASKTTCMISNYSSFQL